MNTLLLPLGNLQCSWVLGLIEDDWTGKWFMLKARCNPSCRKSLDFPGFNGNESWILCVTTYRLSTEIKFRGVYAWNVRVYPHYNSAPRPVILD